MLGTIVNTVGILIGGIIGILFGKALPNNIKSTTIQGIGLAVLLIGADMALKSENILVVITSLVLGGIVGEIIDIEHQLKQFGNWLERRYSKNKQGGEFSKAFVTSSLIYCVGAMAIMGALESGLSKNYTILYVKSLLDGITAIVFASSMGVGVLASAISVFIYQGIITLASSLLQGVLTPDVITEMSAVGGLLIVGVGINVLEIKEIKVGNLLPALIFVVPITMLSITFHLGG